MDYLQLSTLLENITGTFQTVTPDQESLLQKAQQTIANSLLLQDDIGSEHLFANSNFYTKRNIDSKRFKHIKGLAKRAIDAPEDDGLRTFIRTTPIRTAQISGSTPDWAVGAKAVETLGPFANADGRHVWIDVFKTVKLTTLYIGNDPILLFKTVGRVGVRVSRSNFNIVEGTMWIKSKLLSSDAPDGQFTGLKVTSGRIKLSQPLVLTNKKMVLQPGTHLDVSLKMQQSAVENNTGESVNGIDARECEFNLPESFQFNWNGVTKKVTSMTIGSASAKMYGHALNFDYNPVQNPIINYNPQLSMIVFPWQSNNREFKVVTNKSKFVRITGSATILQSYWFLPSAQINTNSPLEAEGNGGVIIKCGKGLRASWTNLASEDVRFIEPLIIGWPQNLTVADYAADGSGASQHFDLWKDELNPYRSSVDVQLVKNAPLMINSSASNNLDFITTQCNGDFKVDRPIKVNGEPFEIRSKASVLMLGASGEGRLIYLYDDNVLEDNQSETRTNASHKPVAIALENALFTVSQVNTCLLFGTCNSTWTQLDKATLFLAYRLYRYLPTLPDPYVGKLKTWERIFGNGNTRSKGLGLDMLISTVVYSPINDDEDKVSTAFYFGSYPTAAVPEREAVPDRTNNRTRRDSRRGGILRRTTNITSRFLKQQHADALTLSKERLKSIENTSLRSMQSMGSIMNAVKVNTSYINESVLASHKLFGEKANYPDQGGAVTNETPVLFTGIIDGALRKEMEFPGSNLSDIWDQNILGGRLSSEPFALLDISSNANQMGVSLSGDMLIIKTGSIRQGEDDNAVVVQKSWPFIVDGMQVKVKGNMLRSFTLPIVAWEPVINLSPPDRSEPPASIKLPMDPEEGLLLYEDDGGPTRIWNNNQDLVDIAPVPAVDAIVEDFKSNPKNYTVSAFTLPFGLKALSYISKNFVEPTKPDIANLRPEFRKNPDGTNKFKGGIQLSLRAGDFSKPVPTVPEKDSPMFPGYTIQFNNLLDGLGNWSGASNLGQRVTEIFNNEFLVEVLSASNKLEDSRGVPVSRIDITGYGANMFSDWISPTAAIAQTSQAKFDVMMGRTAHEVIQVKSILYPWGIRVVRTITVFRSSAGYILRTDSGWKAESDGKFDFSYRYLNLDGDFKTVEAPFEFHPGTIKGLFNVRNIKDAPSVKEYTSTNRIMPNASYVNGIKGIEERNETGSPIVKDVKCAGVYFDADVEIENVIQGHVNKRVISKKILGYVQVAPAGIPLTPNQLNELLASQQGSIGGDLDCVININGSDQQMRLNRFDVNNSRDVGNNPVFVTAAHGTVIMPQAGSWSVVQHNAETGQVTPLPSGTSVPLIRTGKWIKEKVIDSNVVSTELLRIANPLEILRNPSGQTINFGFLQSTDTQKALFLTPAYGKSIKKLLTKTPPIFADAYRLMEGNSIFPNIGNAIDNFGKAMPMLNGVDSAGNMVKAFVTNALTDRGIKVFEVMEVQVEKAGEAIVDQGMSMLQKNANGILDKALKFDIPQFEVPLVDTEALKIYIEYNTKNKPSAPTTDYVDGKLNFDVDSFARDAAESWKSRVNNLAMVVDLGDMKRLMIIKGNFDSKKSKETGYEGGDNSGNNGLPVPEIEFSEALQPVIDILEVLAELSAGDYGETMKKGLKVAMSNSGEIWEYKFEATKDIPLVRFPPSDELYNSAQTPLKLEASLGLGVYFNAALKVTSDPSQLLPTAGAFLKFHGGLKVMCVSVGVGSIYAIGSVDVKIAVDTKVGPTLELAFAFGVSIVVSLPVVGNASVTYMMGITMYADMEKVLITALMAFKGNANLLGGLVTVTIMIEAKGIIEKSGGQTNASVQVTFALDISIFLIIDISFSKTWGEERQIA